MHTPTITRTLALAAWLIIPITSHAAENLLANPSAQGGATEGWTIIAAGGDGWASRTYSADGDGSSFITSYAWCTRSQTVDLLAAGYTEAYLDSSPPIQVREWFKGVAGKSVADKYFLRVELRDETGAVLDSWEAGTQAAPLITTGTWSAEEYRFEDYPAGVRQIYWEDGSIDDEFWGGHYGALLDAAELSFADPAPTAINLTPGTYPVSAPLGGVAGVLSAVDNAGSSHSYALVNETQATALVATGSLWSYLDDGTDQGTVWRGAAFADGAWPTGNAELGFGEGDEATDIAGFESHYTNYFRHWFNIAEGGLAEIESLTLRLKRDDGAVVYLNGTEIARDNLPEGDIFFDTPTNAAASDDGANFHDFDVLPGLLIEGDNVLAVEIHQTSLTTSDASFDLELLAAEIADTFDNALFSVDGDRLLFAQAGPAVPVTIGGTWMVNVQATDDAGNTFVQLLTVTGVDNSDDRDGDGLPDAWEELYFSGIAGQDADDDSDNDGQTEGDELVFGTLPNDPSSRFGISIEAAAPASHLVQWPSDASRQYRLQTSATLEPGSWSDTAAGQRQGTGAMMGETVPDAGVPLQHFRVIVEIP